MIRSSSAPFGRSAFLRGQGFQRVGRGQWLNPNGQSRNMGQIMRHSYGSQFRNLSQPATPQTQMDQVMPQQSPPETQPPTSSAPSFNSPFGRSQGEFNPWQQQYSNEDKLNSLRQETPPGQETATRGFDDSNGPSFSVGARTQQFDPQMMQRLASILGGFYR